MNGTACYTRTKLFQVLQQRYTHLLFSFLIRLLSSIDTYFKNHISYFQCLIEGWQMKYLYGTFVNLG